MYSKTFKANYESSPEWVFTRFTGSNNFKGKCEDVMKASSIMVEIMPMAHGMNHFPRKIFNYQTTTETI